MRRHNIFTVSVR